MNDDVCRRRRIGIAACPSLLAAACFASVAHAAPAPPKAPPPNAPLPKTSPPPPPTTPPATRPATSDMEEPPAEYRLIFNGTGVDVYEGKTEKVPLGRGFVDVKLVSKPDRLFQTSGCSFRVPKRHSFAVVKDERNDVTTWTFTSDRSTITVVRHKNASVDPAATAQLMADAVAKQFAPQVGEDNVKRSTVTRELGGKEYDGLRTELVIAGQHVWQDYFNWRAGGSAFVLIVQNSVDATGAKLLDATKARELLEKTFSTAVIEEAPDAKAPPAGTTKPPTPGGTKPPATDPFPF